MQNHTKQLIEAINEHAAELEAKNERHVYGPAIMQLMLLEERIEALEAAIKDALLCDNYVQITEVLQQALLPGGE